MTVRRAGIGQSLLEYTVLVAAVTSALILTADYVRRAFNAHVNAIEEELNGATEDNVPGSTPPTPPRPGRPPPNRPIPP